MINQDSINSLLLLWKSSKRVVFFGGAGVSTASNIPDFRGVSGIYTNMPSAEEILTPRFMLARPEDFYTFYRKFFMLPDIKPNPAHLVLARLEEKGMLDSIVTQNVDGLHQKAGSKRVIELHGTGETFTCLNCGSKYDFATVYKFPLVPRCKSCNGLIRPDIVLYEEGLPEFALGAAIEAIERADLLVVAGTSLRVFPAAGLVDILSRQSKLVLINREQAPCRRAIDLYIGDEIADVFSELEKQLLQDY